jgi:N-acetyl-gamma-glutamylphosphate reductase
LIKGGSGQGVQNMNVIYNFPESRGLIWKNLLYFYFY